jgi:hypothetical protein
MIYNIYVYTTSNKINKKKNAMNDACGAYNIVSTHIFSKANPPLRMRYEIA